MKKKILAIACCCVMAVVCVVSFTACKKKQTKFNKLFAIGCGEKEGHYDLSLSRDGIRVEKNNNKIEVYFMGYETGVKELRSKVETRLSEGAPGSFYFYRTIVLNGNSTNVLCFGKVVITDDNYPYPYCQVHVTFEDEHYNCASVGPAYIGFSGTELLLLDERSNAFTGLSGYKECNFTILK